MCGVAGLVAGVPRVSEDFRFSSSPNEVTLGRGGRLGRGVGVGAIVGGESPYRAPSSSAAFIARSAGVIAIIFEDFVTRGRKVERRLVVSYIVAEQLPSIACPLPQMDLV
jgi:hypothetical protein